MVSVQIIKVPGISSVKHRSMRDTGNKIIHELRLLSVSDFSIEEIHVNNENLTEQEFLIVKNSVEAFEKNDLTIFLGGDEVIAEPIQWAFHQVFGSKTMIKEEQKGIVVYKLLESKQLKGIIILGIDESESNKIKRAAEVIKEIV